MAEKNCSSLIISAASNMDITQQNEKDISKVFSFLRAKLNAKEKELLELQRTEPCLLAPDSEQIVALIAAISSLHLSTQEGSFIFASSTSVCDNSSSTFVCSTGVDSIKTLPSTIWLPESISTKQTEEEKNEYRLPMVTHLLSLPVNAYVANSSGPSALPSFETIVQTKDQSSYRLPMVSQLFAMPINAFKSSSSSSSSSVIQPTNDFLPVEIEDKKEILNNENKVLPTNESSKSILQTETIYSKEHWLRKSSSSSSESDFVSLDLDEYIEQTSDKMRRLHMEYLAALDQLKTPSNPVDSTQMIKSMYPQMYDRIQQDMSPADLTRLLPSHK